MHGLRFRKYLGEALEDQRKKAKLSRKAMADVLGVNETTVWRWETGDRWPQDSDLVVSIYEREGECSAIDLWNEAVRRANQANAKDELAKFLMPDLPTVADLTAADAKQAKEAVQRASDGQGSDLKP